MSNQEVKVLLYGLGAIGGFYAFILNRTPNVKLTVVARSNYEAVKEHGLKIESENHGSHIAHFAAVNKSPDESEGTFDYIVCAHKAINSKEVPEKFRAVTGPETTFVIMQNGVGNEDPFRETFPECTIISGVIWVGAIQSQLGTIRHTKSELTEIGLFPNPAIEKSVEQKRLDDFASLMRSGGTNINVEENIQVKRWEKVTWNVAWNPLTTLTMVDTQTWLKSSDQSMAMTRRLMREVIDVARACNVPLEYSLIDVLIGRILAMPGLETSMQTDAKEGRPLEVDVIIGTPMRKAVDFGMDVPTLSAVYSLIMAVNGRLRQESN